MVKEVLYDLLSDIGHDTDIRNISTVTGGDISHAARVETGAGTYFAKWNDQVPQDFFEKEADGLQKLRRTSQMNVPDVFAHRPPEDGRPGMIVLEWLGGSGRKTPEAEERLGRQLARMHGQYGEAFGLAYDNYIGLLVQPNGWYKDWTSFYAEKRLQAQIDLARAKGRLEGSRLSKMTRLTERLQEWLGGRDLRPSLLHGDLWGGNWMTSEDGQPYIVDPAVFYGDREMELAFTALFGGFSSRFYDAYQEMLPLEKEYEDRFPLYQLYYLLVHLTLFGEAYGASVDRILERYIG